MKELNLYILEKLRINRNITINNHSFSEGEKIIKVYISNDWNYIALPFSNTFRGPEPHYYIFKEIKNGHMYFEVPNKEWEVDGKDHYKYEKRIKKNSKGYYQTIENNLNRYTTIVIYLNTNDAIKFIENVYSKKDVEKLKDYFDYEIKDDIEFRIFDKEIENILDYLSE